MEYNTLQQAEVIKLNAPLVCDHMTDFIYGIYVLLKRILVSVQPLKNKKNKKTQTALI